MPNQENSPVSITLIGAEGVGKTSMCQVLVRRLGGIALVVPTWPSLDLFIQNPREHAFQNQSEALHYTYAAYRDTMHQGLRPIYADNSPDRVHLVHSWRMHQEGLINDSEWEDLERQYVAGSHVWGNHYVYLRSSLHTIVNRLTDRNRSGDTAHNISIAATVLERWESLVSDRSWRTGKNILELNAEASLDELAGSVETWIKELSKKEG